MKVADIASGARVICPGRAYRRPKVSVVTPTYCRNAEGLLAKCLDSAMAQTFEEFELIVIDDGSSDGSEFTIRDAAFRDDRIVYLRHDRNSGLPAIRTNEGVMRARGDAVAFLFDDNVFRPDFIETAWNVLESSGADVVHTNVHMFAKEGNDFTLGGWPLTLELLRNLNTIPNGGVMVRRSFFDRFGLYDPHILMRRVCDWDLWLRALALGPRFCHIEQIGSLEYGPRSANSIGNTIAWDVKIACAYMLDEARFAERGRRLTPQAIGDYDVLDPTPVRPYVRNGREWSDLVDTVYRPFIERHGANGFDAAFPGNRAASLDPGEGWNAEWSLIGNRRRYVVVTNSVNAWAATWLQALRRRLPGAIVANCPEWQLSSFRPADVDLLVLLDCTSAFLKPQLDAFRAASVPVLYVLGYGERASNAAPPSAINRRFGNNRHLAGLLGHEFYFPQTGACFDRDQREGAKALAGDVYAAVSARGDADRLALVDPIVFPLSSVDLSTEPLPPGTRHICYGADIANGGDAEEIVGLPNSAHVVRNGSTVRPSWEGLGALIESRSGSHILADADMFDAAPLAERVGVAALADHHAVTLTLNRSSDVANSTEARTEDAPSVWQAWIANLALCSQLARHIAQARGTPARRPTVGIFLNSEMFSGSETYGLMMARGLQKAGARVRIFVPDVSDYGGDSDVGPLNRWLQSHDLPPAAPAPYRPGVRYLAMAPADQSTARARLEPFIRELGFDVLICSGFMPLFADLSKACGLLFMALFQPSAYEQRQLAYLRGRVSGILSDSRWALAAHLRLLAAPGAIVRSMMPVDSAAPGTMKMPRTSGAIRIALGGTVQPRKRQLEAIRAVGLLRDRGLAVQLNIYGYELAMVRSYVEDVRQAIKDFDLEGLVVCKGLVALNLIADDNDIALSSSIDESLPQTLIELMRSGLIGVAGLSGGIDELIEDGKTGYLTPDLSPQGLADVLERAINDRNRWPEVAANAGALIERDYSIAQNTTTLLNFLIEGAQLESSPFGRLASAGA